MRPHVTTGNDLRLELGEGPVWDAQRQQAVWVDSEAGRVFRGDLVGDQLTVTDVLEVGEKVGSVAPTHDGGLLVAGEREVHVLDESGCRVESIRVLPEGQRSRLNDGTVDPAGRFLVGSLRLDDRSRQECLWAIDADRTVRQVVDGITVSNGIGFAPDGATMYHVETRPGMVLAFDYDIGSGTATNRRVILDCGETPDGLAVDVEGCLWVAFFGAGQVRRLSPRGEILDVIEIEAPNATCPTFVGPSLDRLLITTARFRLSEDALAQHPLSGALFVTDVPVAGIPVPAWSGPSRRST